MVLHVVYIAAFFGAGYWVHRRYNGTIEGLWPRLMALKNEIF